MRIIFIFSFLLLTETNLFSSESENETGGIHAKIREILKQNEYKELTKENVQRLLDIKDIKERDSELSSVEHRLVGVLKQIVPTKCEGMTRECGEIKGKFYDILTICLGKKVDNLDEQQNQMYKRVYAKFKSECPEPQKNKREKPRRKRKEILAITCDSEERDTSPLPRKRRKVVQEATQPALRTTGNIAHTDTTYILSENNYQPFFCVQQMFSLPEHEAFHYRKT